MTRKVAAKSRRMGSCKQVLPLDNLTNSLTLRDLLWENPGRISCVEMPGPGGHDMDTPEDYQHLGRMI